MEKRLQEIEKELDRLYELACVKYPFISYSNELFETNKEEWKRLNDLHEKASKQLTSYERKVKKEREEIIIKLNKQNGVYWDNEKWIYDVIKTIPQHYELKGQERTTAFIKELESLNGCVVTDDGAGYTLEIFTPYKVYLYRFNRGYGDYPITITKGFIAPSGNAYNNKIFIAKSTRDMKERYFQN